MPHKVASRGVRPGVKYGAYFFNNMQHNIQINQRAVVENGFDLDILDVAIFDFIHNFAHTEVCQKLLTSKGEYYLFKHTFIIQQMPLLKIATPAGIIRRMNKLIDAGLLVRHPDCEGLRRSYYRFGPNYDKMFFGTLNENSQPLKSVEGTLNNFLGLTPNNFLGKHNKDINIDKEEQYNKENSLIIESKRKFKVPTAEEVAEYCEGHGYQIDPEAFCDYYESKGWKVGSTPMKSWQAAVRTWVRRRQSPPPTPSPQYAIREDPMTRMLRRRGLVDEQGRLKSNITGGGCDEQ